MHRVLVVLVVGVYTTLPRRHWPVTIIELLHDTLPVIIQIGETILKSPGADLHKRADITARAR